MNENKQVVKYIYCRSCGRKNRHVKYDTEWICQCGENAHDRLAAAQTAIQNKVEFWIKRGVSK